MVYPLCYQCRFPYNLTPIKYYNDNNSLMVVATLIIDYEQSLFHLVYHAAIFFSQLSFPSHMMDQAKEQLLVVYNEYFL